MRRLLPLLCLALVAAKGGKNKPVPVPEAPAAAPVEAAPAPVEEAPPATPEPIRNADSTVTITYADGSTKGGHVKGIERTVDFYGDDGWTADDGKLRLTVEANGTEKAVPWKDVRAIAVTPGKLPDDVDCTYSSDFTPWMYECTLRTTAAVTLKDGSKGTVSNRHLWRFTMDDGATVEFSIYKYVVREQDTKVVDFGDESTENFGLYSRLQDRLRSDVKSAVVKSVSVQ